MKRIFLLLAFILVSYKMMAQEFKTQLIVWAKDGTKVAFLLSEKPKITFTETDLVITTKDIEVNYALDNMVRFTYESNDYTAIRDLESDEVSFRLDKESLLFSALKANSTLTIYALNGNLVMKRTIRQDGEYAFPISDLNAGVYMVNVNGLTYKIVKR